MPSFDDKLFIASKANVQDQAARDSLLEIERWLNSRPPAIPPVSEIGLVTPFGPLSNGSPVSHAVFIWIPVYETFASGVSVVGPMWLGSGVNDRITLGGSGIAWTSPDATIIVESFQLYFSAMDGSSSIHLNTNNGPYSITAPLTGSPFSVPSVEWSVQHNTGGVLSYSTVTGRITTTAAGQYIAVLEASAKLP